MQYLDLDVLLRKVKGQPLYYLVADARICKLLLPNEIIPLTVYQYRLLQQAGTEYRDFLDNQRFLTNESIPTRGFNTTWIVRKLEYDELAYHVTYVSVSGDLKMLKKKPSVLLDREYLRRFIEKYPNYVASIIPTLLKNEYSLKFPKLSVWLCNIPIGYTAFAYTYDGRPLYGSRNINNPHRIEFTFCRPEEGVLNFYKL